MAVRGVGDDGLLPQASNLAGAKIQNGSTAWYVIFGASAGGLAAALTLTRAVREWWRQGFGRRHVAEKRLPSTPPPRRRLPSPLSAPFAYGYGALAGPATARRNTRYIPPATGSPPGEFR